MKNLDKYRGVLPAFYACYNDVGEVCGKRTEAFTHYLADKGVKGLYVCGSSGECIYQSVEERKKTLEHVMKAKGDMTIIAHVACNNTRDSIELARHAESLGVDAIAAIPPIYFKLPDHAIAAYWNDISAAAPNTDFVIYNIPQLAGVALSMPLFKEMRKNPRIIGVKNSSPAVQDIQMWKAEGGPDCIVFNGPDEQFVGGYAIGADGGIGGTYAAVPELYIRMDRLMREGNVALAREIQHVVNEITYSYFTCKGNMYAVIKEILRQKGMNIGTVRAPLPQLDPADAPQIAHCIELIDAALAKYAK